MPRSRRRRRGGGRSGLPGVRTTSRAFVRPRARRRWRRWLFIAAAAIIAILVIGSFGLTTIPGLQPRGTGASSYKEGVGVPQELMPTARHLDGQTIQYNTVPATSGDHWSSQADCVFYEEFVPDEKALHNLEHGQVVISHNLTDLADVARLRDIHDGLPAHNDWLVTRFYNQINEGEIALTAWGVLDRFTGIDEDRITAFYDAYKSNRFSGETSQLGRGIPCPTRRAG